MVGGNSVELVLWWFSRFCFPESGAILPVCWTSWTHPISFFFFFYTIFYSFSFYSTFWEVSLTWSPSFSKLCSVSWMSYHILYLWRYKWFLFVKDFFFLQRFSFFRVAFLLFACFSLCLIREMSLQSLMVLGCLLINYKWGSRMSTRRMYARVCVCVVVGHWLGIYFKTVLVRPLLWGPSHVSMLECYFLGQNPRDDSWSLLPVG